MLPPPPLAGKEFVCRYILIDAYTCDLRISTGLAGVSSAGEVQQCIREGRTKGRGRHMRQPMFIIRLALALIVLASGCAAPTAEVGSVLTQPGGSGSANGADLKGTWRGSFEGVNTGDSGRIHGDIVCQINDDGTYKTTWVTRLVAGSTRGGRLEMSGTVVARGKRVMFNSSLGSRITLRHVGDTLYGLTIDPAAKRLTVTIELRKVHTVPEAP